MPHTPAVNQDTLGAVTSASLLERVGTRDAEAWRRLVRLYGPLVYFWCRHAQLQSADMADVFQEVFRAVAQHMANFRRHEPGQSFRGWLRAITRNKLNDHYRQIQKEPGAEGGSTAQAWLQSLPEASPLRDEHAPLAEEDSLIYRQALDAIRLEFEDRTWQAFWRTAVDGQTSRTVADELGISPEAVRKAKSRVLCRLRDEFGDALD